jgi:hypothetical protein
MEISPLIVDVVRNLFFRQGQGKILSTQEFNKIISEYSSVYFIFPIFNLNFFFFLLMLIKYFYDKIKKRGREDILKEVNVILEKNFGMNLVELTQSEKNSFDGNVEFMNVENNKRISSSNQSESIQSGSSYVGAANITGYVLVSCLSPEDLISLGPPPSSADVVEYGFLFVILSLIFLFGGSILEGFFFFLVNVNYRRTFLLFIPFRFVH